MDEFIALLQEQVWRDLKKERRKLAAVGGDVDATEDLVKSVVDTTIRTALAPAVDLAR